MAVTPRRLRSYGLASAAAFAVMAVAAGCHFGTYNDPNDPLHGQRNFAIEPIQFNNLIVGDKPEPVYLSAKKPEQQQGWQVDKAEMARLLGERLARVTSPVGIMFTSPGAPPPPPMAAPPPPGAAPGAADPNLPPGAAPAMAAPPPVAAGPFIVRVNIDLVEPGNFNGFFNIDTTVRATVSVFGPQGEPLGQNGLATVVRSSLGNPSSGGRMREAGEQLGEQLGHYLLRRTGLGY
jgi:hypothetical protein